MALKEPFDEMLLELTNDQRITIGFDGDDQNIPINVEDNTAGLAILELKKRFKPDLGVKVTITKHMTSGCGLGTTGASASSAIYGLNKLLNLNLTDNELVDLARMGEIASGGSPHADNVAAAMLGGFILIKDYHPIDVLKLRMPEFPVVLAVIKKSQRTTRGFITYEIGQEKLKEQMAHCSRVIHAIHTQDVEEFGRAISVDHIAEPVRSAVIENYKETKATVIAAGAYGSTVSGGGSSVITICSADMQDEIAAIMEHGLKANANFVKIIKTTTSNQGVCEML